MGTRATAVIKNANGQEAYLYQHNAGFPDGFAQTLRSALAISQQDELFSALLPHGRPFTDRIELDTKPHAVRVEYKYDIIEAEQGRNIIVSGIAYDLSKPSENSDLRYELLQDAHNNWVYVPIFQGTVEDFLRWSESYDEDADMEKEKRIELSKNIPKSV